MSDINLLFMNNLVLTLQNFTRSVTKEWYVGPHV